MNYALLKKYLRESLLLWLSIAIGLFAFSWFRVWVVSEVDTARFQQILELLPKDWRRFSLVNFDWLVSYLGRTALTLDEPMIVMLIGAWSIVRGSDAVSGELNRGTMEMLLSQPVSRRRIFVQHAMLTVFGLLLLVLLVWLGMSIAVYTTNIDVSQYRAFRIPLTQYRIPLTWLDPQTQTIPMSDRVHPLQFLPGIVNLFSFGFLITGYAMMFSSWDRYRWRTLGFVIGIYFVAALIKVAAMSTATLRWLHWFTFFALYEPALSIEIADLRPQQLWYLFRYTAENEWVGIGPLGMNLALIALGLGCFWIGTAIFERRDLPAPM